MSPARLGLPIHGGGICVGEALIVLGLSGRGSTKVVAFVAVVRRGMTVGVAVNTVTPVGAAMASVDVYVGNQTRLAAAIDAV